VCVCVRERERQREKQAGGHAGRWTNRHKGRRIGRAQRKRGMERGGGGPIACGSRRFRRTPHTQSPRM